jgi:hypothetical protein
MELELIEELFPYLTAVEIFQWIHGTRAIAQFLGLSVEIPFYAWKSLT